MCRNLRTFFLVLTFLQKVREVTQFPPPLLFFTTQIYYSLGCHYFWHDNFRRAHWRFKQCARQLNLLPGCPSLVDPAQLRGFTCASAQVRLKRRVAGREGEDEEEEGEKGEMETAEGLGGGRETLLEKLELCRINDIEVYRHAIACPTHSVEERITQAFPSCIRCAITAVGSIIFMQSL